MSNPSILANTTIEPSLLIEEQENNGETSNVFSDGLENVSNTPTILNKKVSRRDILGEYSYLSSKQNNAIVKMLRKEGRTETSADENKTAPIRKQLDQIEYSEQKIKQLKQGLLTLNVPDSRSFLTKVISTFASVNMLDKYADIRSAITAYNASKNNLERNFQLLSNVNQLSKPHQEIEENLNAFCQALEDYHTRFQNIKNIISNNQDDSYYQSLTSKTEIISNTVEEISSQLVAIKKTTTALKPAREYAITLIPKLTQCISPDEVLTLNQENYVFIDWASELNRLCQLEDKETLSKEFWHTAIKEMIDQNINLPYANATEFFTAFQFCFDIPLEGKKPFLSFESIYPVRKNALVDEATEEKKLRDGIHDAYSTALKKHNIIARNIEYVKIFHTIYQSKFNQLETELAELEQNKQLEDKKILEASTYLECFHNLLFKPVTEKIDYSHLSKENTRLYEIVNQLSIYRSIRQKQPTSEYALSKILEPLLSNATNQSALAERLVNTEQALYANPDIDLERSSKQNQENLNNRYERLEDYSARLNELIKSLEKENLLDEALKKQLKIRLKQAQNEIELITELKTHQNTLQEINLRIQDKENIRAQASKHKDDLANNIINPKEKELELNIANMNLVIYSLRAEKIKKITDRTYELQRKLKETIEPIELYEKIKIRYGELLKNKNIETLLADSSIQDSTLNAYRIWQEKDNDIRNEINRLQLSFRENFLELQQEQLRAQESGGYPESLNWYSQAYNKWAPRALPNTLELNMQLANQGVASINIVTALNILWQRATNNANQTGALNKFYEVIKGSLTEFSKLAKDYPTQTQMLAGDIQHFMRIMHTNAFGIPSECINMVKNAWSRGTTESIVRDLLLGSRSDLRGLTAIPELSKETIACLYLISYAPYLANMMNGASMANYIPGINNVPAAAQVLNTLISIAKTDIEKSLAQTLTQNRDIEVTGNALLKSLATEGTITERIKIATNYIAGREITRAVGTVTRDLLEVGKVGVFKRLGQEIGLWWKHSTFKNKLALITIAVVTPIAIAASVLGFFVATVGSIGIAPILLAIFISLGGASMLVPILWRLLSRAIGLDRVHKKVNHGIDHRRIHDVLNHLQEDQTKARILAKPDNLEQLKILLAAQKASLKNNTPEHNDLDEKLEANIESFFTKDVIRRWIDSSMKTSAVKNPEVFRTTAIAILKQKLLLAEVAT